MTHAQALHEVPLTDVKLTDGFWAPKLAINRTVTIPHDFKMCEETGRIANFDRASGAEKGPHQGFFFNDSDVYKVIEAASYSLAVDPDPTLDAYVDKLIAKIAAAQQADGYLYTFYTNEPAKRLTNLKDAHELYCAGHLIEAAVAHYKATGKRTFLDVAIKLANHIDGVFGENKRHDVDGHEEVELALLKLADATGDAKYKTLAVFFIHERGRSDRRKLFGPYYQDLKPVEQFDEVIGHAVRQMYLACAMTDLASRGDSSMSPALDRMWLDLTSRKMYITGGVGAMHEGESFGPQYELPNESAYAETCAGIGNALWNHRMNLLTGDAKYADVVEQVTYNGMLAGVSLSGDKFFYVNPLASKGKHHRQGWYDCACCPPNVARYLASLPSRAYATSDDANGGAIYVNLYAAGEGRVIRPGGEIRITQETKYPWDGKVKLKIAPEPAAKCAIKLRIPGWINGENGGATIAINGKPVDAKIEKGYATLAGPWRASQDRGRDRGPADRHGEWHGGDVIDLELPLQIARVHADPRVKDDAGRVAIRRGPIVYCVEGVDNGGAAMDLSLPTGESLATEFKPDLLGGVTIIKGKSLTAIPYFAWDNREAGEMAVWLKETP